MNKRPLTAKIVVIANAILLVAAFVGCPARKGPDVVPLPIAAPLPHFERFLSPGQTTPSSQQDSKNDTTR